MRKMNRKTKITVLDRLSPSELSGVYRTDWHRMRPINTTFNSQVTQQARIIATTQL
jgi:hypothetical protein